VYIKARATHEKKKHNLVVPSDSSPVQQIKDHQKECTEAIKDAVRGGDVERLMRLYNVDLFSFKAYGHSHYAYSTSLQTLQINITLPPRMAHSVIWNRFWNGRGAKGKNIPLNHGGTPEQFLEIIYERLGAKPVRNVGSQN